MTMNPRDKDFRAKKETEPKYVDKFPKITTAPSSRQWSTYKNPRIVRVSRTFGGKDRHSKVCTVRGLRDRRIRLSVPTAIQLYDLQDRLGLSQPSKVVDWLLDATKNEIDQLPPLPMLPGTNFSTPFPPEAGVPNPHSLFVTPNNPVGISQGKELGLKIHERDDHQSSEGKDKWIFPTHQENNQDQGFGGFVAQNLFPLGNIIHPNMPYNSLFHWDPPNLSLSQFGGGYSFSGQSNTEDQPHSSNSLPMPSCSSHQLHYSPSMVPPAFHSSYTSAPSFENNDLRIQHNPLMPTTLHLISSPRKSLALHSVKSQQENTSTERSDKYNRKYS